MRSGIRALMAMAALCFGAGISQAQYSDGTIKIGVMNDQSGTYADISGPGAVVATRMAVEDFGAAKTAFTSRRIRCSFSRYTPR